MKSYRVTGIVFVMSLICLVGTVRANMIPDGDFTTDPASSGWVDLSGPITWLNGTGTSPDGSNVSVTGNTWFYQPTFNTVPSLVLGQTYRASFLGAVLTPGAPDNGILTVNVETASGSVTHDLSSALDSTWRQYSLDFTATSADLASGGGYRVSFSPFPTNGAVVGIDNVSLTAVPEPSAFVLLGAALLGLLAYAWRKRR